MPKKKLTCPVCGKENCCSRWDKSFLLAFSKIPCKYCDSLLVVPLQYHIGFALFFYLLLVTGIFTLLSIFIYILCFAISDSSYMFSVLFALAIVALEGFIEHIIYLYAVPLEKYRGKPESERKYKSKLTCPICGKEYCCNFRQKFYRFFWWKIPCNNCNNWLMPQVRYWFIYFIVANMMMEKNIGNTIISGFSTLIGRATQDTDMDYGVLLSAVLVVVFARVLYLYFVPLVEHYNNHLNKDKLEQNNYKLEQNKNELELNNNIVKTDKRLTCPVCGRDNCCSVKNKILSPILDIFGKPNHCKYCRSWIVTPFIEKFMALMLVGWSFMKIFIGDTSIVIQFVVAVLIYVLVVYYSEMKEDKNNCNNQNKYIE